MHGAYVIEDRKNHRTLLLSLAPPFFLTFSDMSTDLCAVRYPNFSEGNRHVPFPYTAQSSLAPDLGS